jgi:hypothetical protein
LQAYVPQGAALYLDVPEANLAAMALAERHGRCFRNGAHVHRRCAATPLRRLFGDTFELG